MEGLHWEPGDRGTSTWSRRYRGRAPEKLNCVRDSPVPIWQPCWEHYLYFVCDEAFTGLVYKKYTLYVYIFGSKNLTTLPVFH